MPPGASDLPDEAAIIEGKLPDDWDCNGEELREEEVVGGGLADVPPVVAEIPAEEKVEAPVEDAAAVAAAGDVASSSSSSSSSNSDSDSDSSLS